MLLYRLKEIECVLEKEATKNTDQLNTVLALKNSLLSIDFKVEEVPEYSFDKLVVLLKEINSKALSFEEKKLLKEIIAV